MTKLNMNIAIVLWSLLVSCTLIAQHGMNFCITDRGTTGCKNLSDPRNDPYGDYTGRPQGAGGPLSPGSGAPTMGGDLGNFLGSFTEKLKDATLSLDGKHRNKKEKEKAKRGLVASVGNRFEQIERGSQLIQENLDDIERELSSSDLPSAVQHIGAIPETKWPEISFEPQNGPEAADMPEFMTSIISEKGEAVRDAYEKSEQAKSAAKNLGVDYPDSFEKAAKESIRKADRSYYEGNNAQGDRYIAFSSELVDQGLYSSPYYGSGKDWYDAMHGRDIYGNKLDSTTYTYAVVGVAQNLAYKKGFSDVGGAALRNVPRLTVIQGGGGVGNGLNALQRMGIHGVKLARLTNIVGAMIMLVNPSDIGPHLAIEDSVIPPFAINDSRITLPSPKISADPSEWMEYLTGTGRYSGQKGVIDIKDKELAAALLKQGYRNPGQIEQLTRAANQVGLDANDLGHFENDFSYIGKPLDQIVGIGEGIYKPTQEFVNPKIIDEKISEIRSGRAIDPIEVLVTPNGTYIIEGHHRYIASIITGKPIPVLIFEGALVGIEWKDVSFKNFNPDFPE